MGMATAGRRLGEWFVPGLVTDPAGKYGAGAEPIGSKFKVRPGPSLKSRNDAVAAAGCGDALVAQKNRRTVWFAPGHGDEAAP